MSDDAVSAFERFKVKLIGSPESGGTRCYALHSWHIWTPYQLNWGHPMAPHAIEFRERRVCARCGRIQDRRVKVVKEVKK